MESLSTLFLPESLSSTISMLNDILSGSYFSNMLSLDSIQSMMDSLNSSVHIGILIVTLIIALLGCFLGYKFTRFFMAVTGFFAGIGLGFLLSTKLLNLSVGISIIVCVVGGIFMAAISFWIYRLFLFLLCFLFTFVFAAELIPFTNDIQFFLCTLAGFIVGAISQKFLRPVIILTTSIAFGIWSGFIALDLAALMNLPVPEGTLYKILAGVVIAILGMVVQFLTTHEPDKSSRRKHHDDDED